MILLIDNYDSFSYNLVQMVGAMDPDIQVVRNDAVTPEEILALSPRAVILSPGPGYPSQAGVCMQAVRRLEGIVPILGVCLGHQAICEAYGATVGHAARLMHGKMSRVSVKGDCPLFEGLPLELEAARYHSLAVREETLPPELLVTARSEDGEVMAVRHTRFPTYGLQFHPESILTPLGSDILENFLRKA